jgi:hypothetical protein
MWPLGGLAFCAVPHTARANLITAVGGPAVNVVICLVAGAAIFAASYTPPINVFETSQLYYPELHNWQSGGDGYPYEETAVYVDETGKRWPHYLVHQVSEGQYAARLLEPGAKWVKVTPLAIHVYPAWVLWASRLFWMSWMLLLFNLIPAFPLDGGRILQCILWGRSGDYRSATQVACWSGLVTSLVFMLLSFWRNDALFLGLALFMMFASYQQLVMLDRGAEEAGAFGYDFSKGYGGFGPDEENAPPPKTKRPGPIKRWAQARRAKKMQKEIEQRAADEARLDELLDKIGRLGKESLTADEKRFMDRVSQRYRNRP